jgi:cytidylate kinase
MAYMIISFSGAAGSGKSTIAVRLAKELGWPHYYMGGLRREAAKRRGITLAEYNILGETDPSTDQEVDEYQKKLGETDDNFIVEGRTSWYLIPHSLKIYLDVDENEGIKRIFGHLQQKNERNEDKDLTSLADVKESVKSRLLSDSIRYKKYYGIDVNDKSQYDFCLDTTHLNPEEAYQAVYKFVLTNLDNKKN